MDNLDGSSGSKFLQDQIQQFKCSNCAECTAAQLTRIAEEKKNKESADQQKVLEANPELCNNQSTNDMIDCFRSYIQRNNLFEVCNKKSSEEFDTAICVFENIKARKDVLKDICDIFKDFNSLGLEKQRNEFCLASIAVFNKDLASCDETGQYKGTCYAKIASNNSVGLIDCDKAGIDYVGCYIAVAARTKNISICSEVPSTAKVQCMQQVSMLALDLNICLQITDADTASGCVSNFLSKTCPTYTDSNLQDCNMTGNDCLIISEIRDKFQRAENWLNPDICYYGIAKKVLSINECEKIIDITIRQQCKELITHAT